MRLTLSLLLCWFVPFVMMGQAPVANFTATPTTGCSPLAVKFTDQSTGSPTSWVWNFGNGQLSTKQDPGNINFPPGTYTITLTVGNGNGFNSVTKTNYIVSNPSPSASFAADITLACLPAQIQFTDKTVPNAGTIVEWLWNFGDGTTSTLQNPKHTYTVAGYYDVNITVKSTTGCQASAGLNRFIRVVNGVKADFSSTGPSTCSAPYTIAYKNLTSGPGNLTYSWDLGNGSFPTQPSPSTVYNTAGTYTVKLKAQSDFGCADSIQKSIPINGITTSFSASKDSVCLGAPITFQSTSSSTPTKVLWDFGDGTTSTLLNPPAKVYANPGAYTVRLSSTFANCADVAVKTVRVFGKPPVSFTSSKAVTCKAPLAVTFQNTSPDAVSSQWDFGDGGTGTGSPASHTYASAGTGTYAVTLAITDSKGCQNSLKQDYVRILPPYVNVGPQVGVCVGQAYIPAPIVGTIDGSASWVWDFGDGTPAVSTFSPSHTYAAPGLYAVKLVVTTADGCKDSSTKADAAQVGARPIIAFDKDINSVCRSSVVTFTNQSTPQAPPASVLWDFDDGTISTDPNPRHKFAGTGSHNVMLTVSTNGCIDSLRKPNFVQVLPPLANFGYKQDCGIKTSVTFSDSSEIDPAVGVSYKWNFGDPASTISTSNPPVTFNYPSSAIDYNVQLIVYNGPVCSDTITKVVRMIDEKASFTFNKASATYCRNEDIVLSASNDRTKLKAVYWSIDGQPYVPTAFDYTVRVDVTGTHTARFILEDINGCKDTSAARQFFVTGPTALFGVTNNGGCKNSTITFTDSSKNSGTGSITKWVFDFGDGSAAQTFTAPPFTHKYADTGVYSVKLTVSENGSNVCVDSIRMSTAATITKPVVYFSAAQTTICPGAPLQFTDSSFGAGLTYNWNFGDGGTASTQNPQHTFNGKDLSYTVKLVATDKFGCPDSLTRSNYITTRSPKFQYSVKDTVSLCPPLETKFTFTGTDYESFYWDFGDGGSSSLANTNHFYNNYGKFTPKLYVTGYGGCLDSASANINVIDASSATNVVFGTQSACNELTVNFSVTPPYSTKFTFFFGDGEADSSQQTSFQHLYNLPNLYAPLVLVYDNVGCERLIGSLGVIHIYGAVPLFGMNKDKFCDSGTVTFTDFSQEGDDKIVSSSWDFGDGSPSVPNTGSVTHSYRQPGLYIAGLTVNTQYPCSKTFYDTIRVLATPQPIITSADGVCYNMPINFTGSLLVPPDTAIVWKWGLGNGQTSSLQNPSATYSDTGIHRITLEATNSLGCKNDTTKDIIVNPLPVITVSGDTSIVVGGTGLTLPLTYSNNTVSYNWTPAGDLSCTDCPNPIASPKYSTTYKVNVTDANGCVNSRSITVLVSCTKNNFFVPNTFSPNGDGTNDRFYPRGTGLNLIQSLRIFNRWGEMVFEKRNFPANDASAGWDGTYKGKPAAADAYIYLVDIICDNASIITSRGNVMLIR